MAISIKFHSPVLEQLLSGTNTAALRQTARTGLCAASDKANDTIAYAKLRRAFEDVQDEISLQMCLLGEMVYATHCGTPSNSEEMQKTLEYADSLHEVLDGYEHEMKLLRGIPFCPVCGAENAPDNTFCTDCGQPLSPHSADQA